MAKAKLEEDAILQELDRVRNRIPKHLDASDDDAAKGLAQLVLGLVDLLRRLLERQALRRMEGGTLSETEIERMGQTFMLLEERMKELCEAFGIDPDELDLGIRLDTEDL